MRARYFSFIIVLAFFGMQTAKAQQINYESIAGVWDYSSANKKSKTSYEFTLEKTFKNIMERGEKEIKTEGDFKLDKKGEIDRLVLTSKIGETGPQVPTSYYFIRFSGKDTLIVQLANDRQSSWQPITRKNTMTFLRKKEKAKE